MKVKKEYLILIAVIAALGLYLGLRTRDRTHFELPKPAPMESGTVDRLVIARPDGTIELIKKDARWVIEPQGYRADDITVKNMLNQLNDLTVTALVSESGSYERYDLNAEKRINVQAYTGGQKKRDLDIGRPAPTQQHTFVKLEGDPNVYHARGTLQSTFDKALDSLRDKVVLAFEPDNLTAIEIRKGTQSTVLTRVQADGGQSDARTDAQVQAGTQGETPSDAQADTQADAQVQAEGSDPQGQWVAGGGRSVDPASIDPLLSAMSQLKCDGYTEQPVTAQEPVWVLTFTGEDGAHTLTLFPKEENGSRFAAGSSDSPHGFWLPEARVKDFERHIDQLLGLEPPKADS